MRRTLSILVFIAATSMAAWAQERTSFPATEWDRATAILMHTPAEELFDGVIHPYAGLFEYYFDVEQAAKECGFAEVRWIWTNGVITSHGGPGAFGMAGFAKP